MTDREPAALRIVHEGRGGHIEVGDRRYAIEHIERGLFAIHFPSGNRSKHRHEDLILLLELAAEHPERWTVEDRNRARGTRSRPSR